MEDFNSSVLALLPMQPSQVLTQSAGYFVDDVVTRLKDVSNTKLKEMLRRKGVTEVPSSKPASLRAEFPAVQ